MYCMFVCREVTSSLSEFGSLLMGSRVAKVWGQGNCYLCSGEYIFLKVKAGAERDFSACCLNFSYKDFSLQTFGRLGSSVL